SSRRRHTRSKRDWSSDVCSSDLKLLNNVNVSIDVVEVARIDADAQLVAENIALQLEKRIAFRRAMKQAMQRTMRSGVQGIKVMRSEEHTSELSHVSISYAVLCLK